MDSNKIAGSTVAGRDIVSHSCPLQGHTSKESVADIVSNGILSYFVSRTRELELLLEIYRKATVECLMVVNDGERRRIHKYISTERKKVFDRHIK